MANPDQNSPILCRAKQHVRPRGILQDELDHNIALQKIGLFQKDDLGTWIQSFDEYASRFGLSDSKKLEVVGGLLVGEARVWHWINTPFHSFTSWRAKITERFDVNPATLFSAMQTVTMKDFKNPEDFTDRFQYLDKELRRVSSLEPWGAPIISPGTKLLNSLIIQYFVAALVDPFKKVLALFSPRTLDQALSLVRKIAQQPYYQPSDFLSLLDTEDVQAQPLSPTSMQQVHVSQARDSLTGEAPRTKAISISDLSEHSETVNQITTDGATACQEPSRILELQARPPLPPNSSGEKSSASGHRNIPKISHLPGLRSYPQSKLLELSRSKSRPPSSFHLFIKENLHRVKKANPCFSHRQAFQAVCKLWGTASANPKNKK